MRTSEWLAQLKCSSMAAKSFEQNVGEFVIALRVANYQVNVTKINKKIKGEGQGGEH
jgi:hypothetical protein